MGFSERFGFKKFKEKIQDESMDDALKNSIWNALRIYYFNIKDYHHFSREKFDKLFKMLWINHFKLPLDTLRTDYRNKYMQIRKFYFENLKWNEIYDLIEFIVNVYPDESKNQQFITSCNLIFKSELSAYRFAGTKITKITSETELAEIKEALENKDVFKPVSRHLNAALKLFSDRKSPDYKNTIKESISSVEAMCQIITQNKNATLGEALKVIEKQGNIELHRALKLAFDKLYGYTSNADGIRHGSGLMEDPDLDFEDAKFMLVSCSAFINYLKEKVNKAKIKISNL